MTCVSASLSQHTFPFLVEKVRVEIREKFAKAHQVLINREKGLLDELQRLLEDYTGEGMEEEIKQMNESKDTLCATLKGNTTGDVPEQSIAPIDSRIKELEKRLEESRSSYKSITLEWDESLEERLEVTGKLILNAIKKTIPHYHMLSQPVASFGTHSITVKSAGVFGHPKSVAIDPITHYIYVCDGYYRIQVFDESFRFIFLFQEKMNGPDNICIRQDKVYVTQFQAHCLNVYSTQGALLRSVGSKGDDELQFDEPAGIDISIDKNRIYVAELQNCRVQCLNFDLTFNSFIPDNYLAKDVKLTSNEVIVLSCDNPCVAIYNYAHQSIRKIITRGIEEQMNLPACLFIDELGNLLISDYKDNCVRVFSQKGGLIHQIGTNGEERGQFINPRGITIDNQGRVVILSDNPNYAVQFF